MVGYMLGQQGPVVDVPESDIAILGTTLGQECLVLAEDQAGNST